MDEMSICQVALGICVGISLSAACGFRIFVPMLVVSVAANYFGIHLNEGFQWAGTGTAFVVLSAATVCEICAYYIPWVDNALDLIHTPLALVAGTILMAGMLPELNPAVKWCAACILGSGAAGATKMTSAALRGISSATTGGTGNCIVSTIENMAATLFSVLAFIIPIVTCVILILCFAVFLLLLRKVVRKMRWRQKCLAHSSCCNA